ncbi:hemerythrin HHE cation binding domain-containing protein [Streptomyces davaonensis JCM 4913]|uniref:Hemerythrin HHE cation binding domain-containing protein n=1 Tax=Streptomyces davaonensis (strain DSM 101723 / JCM 4913 / KCC S-0913 / 768) TaxID=1214101 RepID=K4QXT9_STRDJ|nr:DUF2249 domain-containing protein [Streptomyces davaonensis]CCK25868.1 hemerythrin HHE cation binding domain-containing protein [Streptomyces davaonensis JCM 4913]
MSTLTIASDPQDAAAAEAVEAHHTQLAGELAGRVAMLIAAAERDPAAADAVRAGLVDFCEQDLLPHAAAEEETLYPVAHDLPAARLLIDGMLAEHRRLAALVEALRTAGSAVRAAAEGRALQVLFVEHLEKENALILPLLAGSPEISLAGLLSGMLDILGHGHEGEAAESGGGCGGTCGCGGSDGTDVPELDVRTVPHSIRHATVFGAIAAVPSGRAMVLVAPHDPLPLLGQIEDRHPGAFAVDYLERGPEAWRLLLTHR